MTRHVDLGDNRDTAIGRVTYDAAHRVLRVVPAVNARQAGGRIDVGCCRTARRHAPGAYRGEPRVLADLEAPGLVVGQVPVQHVELVQRHPVDEALDELRRLVVTRRVQHKPAPGEAWRVVDAHGRHRGATRRL